MLENIYDLIYYLVMTPCLIYGDGEMARWLRPLTALAEDLSWIPNTTWRLKNFSNSREVVVLYKLTSLTCREVDNLLWSL